MHEKELIINKNNELLSIINRKEYTKLTINCEINPKLLFGFINIKELTINSDEIINEKKLEQNINLIPFIKHIEKLNLINIKYLGKKKNHKKKDSCVNNYVYYVLAIPNLKSINFIYTKKTSYGEMDLNNSYIHNCNKLEEIIFNVVENIKIINPILLPSSLKKIIIKFLDTEFILNFDYIPTRIDYFKLDRDSKKIYIGYSNGLLIKTDIELDILTNKIKEEHMLTELNDEFIKDNILSIPDYITKISYYGNKPYLNPIEHLLFNINLLSNIKVKTAITDLKYLDILKSIEIRTNNEMSLYPSIKININDYGIINDLYIEDNKLFILFKEYMLVVNEYGVVSKEEIKKEIKEIEIIEPEKNILDDYSISELEEYLQYRKLLDSLRNDNDIELYNAMNVIGDRIIKKLTK